MAPRSSIIARAVKKIFIEFGTRFPNRAAMPSVKAISVADGIAHPLILEVPLLNSANTIAGTIMPPIAPTMGSDACSILESSPLVNSLFISMPANKKNTDMSKSLISAKGESGKCNCVIKPAVNGRCQKEV